MEELLKLKKENELLKLQNDELQKMAYIFRWMKEDYQQNQSQTNIYEKLQAFCRKYRKIYIYGAGIKGDRIYNAIKEVCNVEGFVVTKSNRAKEKSGKKIFELKKISKQLCKEDVGVVVALNVENTISVLPLIVEEKLNSVYFAE